MVERLIPSPYATQVGNDWGWDCGAACDAMVIALKTGRAYNVADLAREAGIPQEGGTGMSCANIRDQLLRYGVIAAVVNNCTGDMLYQRALDGLATIPLVSYPALYPQTADRYDKHFTGSHFVLIAGTRDGTLLVHDPLRPDETQGAYRPISITDMDNALRRSGNPRQVTFIMEGNVNWIDTLKTELAQTVPTNTLQITANGKKFAGQASFLQTALGVTYTPPVEPPATVQYVQNRDGLIVRTAPAGSDTGKRLPYATKIKAQGMYTVTGSAYYWTKITECDTVAGVVGNYCASRRIDGTEVFLAPTNPTQAP